MSRDIRITPHLGSTATGEYPEIKFRGISQSYISLKVDDDGSVVYTGTYGSLFNITDNKDGLLHSVNDISGLPILSVYSYDYVQMGKWDKYTLCVNSDKVGVGLTSPSGILHIENNGALFTQLKITGSSSQTNPLTTWEDGGGTVSYIESNGDLTFFGSSTHTIKSADKSNTTTGDVYLKTGDTNGIGAAGNLYAQVGYNTTNSNYGVLYLNNSGGNIYMLNGSGGVTTHRGVLDFSSGKNGIRQGTYNNPVTLAREVVEMGNWTMGTGVWNVVHSLSSTEYLTIRNVTAIVQDDNGANLYPVTMGDLTNSGVLYGVCLYSIDSSRFNLNDDATTYNAFSTPPGGNRGWIYYEYTPD